MRCRQWCKRFGVLTCLGLLQCTAVQPVPLRTAFQGVPAAIRIDPEFRTGLDRLAETKSWPLAANPADDDWLLLGVKVQWGGPSNPHERVWFVRVVETIDPEEAEGGRTLASRRFEYDVPFGVGGIAPDSKITVSCRRIRIEAYDARGEFIAQWSRLMPMTFPEASLYQALATLPLRGPMGGPMAVSASSVAMRGNSPGELEAARRDQDRGLYKMVATLQTLGTSPPMRSIRGLVEDHVVRMPSIIALLLSGLKPSVTASMTTAMPSEFPWVFDRANVPCYQAEFATLLAGERLFDCRVIAGPNEPPMDLLGGLLVIEAVHPEMPGNRLTVRVLASSRMRLGSQSHER